MDLRKLKDRAEVWYKKGKFDKALEAFHTLAQAEPDNPRWSLKAGETYKKLGKSKLAVDAFRSAARRYANMGFDLKAIAMCNLVPGIDPEHRETQAMLQQFHDSRFGKRAVPAPAVPAPAAEEIEIEAEPPPAPPPVPVPRPRTIPPGESLDAAKLHELVPEARKLPPIRPMASDIFVIPLDEELDAAFLEALGEPEEEPTPTIPPTPLFSSLDPGSLRSIVHKASVRHFQDGEKILREGEPGDSLFVLVEGEVRVYHEGPPPIELTRLQEGAFFGEIAVLTKFTRTSTVEATTDVTVLEISTEVIGELIDEHPAVLKVLLKFFRDRLVDTLVETSPLFAPFARSDRTALASRFQLLEADPETQFLTAGEEADGLYILLSGRLEVNPGVGPRRPGDNFGETSLLNEDPDPYGLTTRSKCWVLKLERRTFREVIMTHPQVLAYVADVADRRREQLQHPDRKLPLI